MEKISVLLPVYDLEKPDYFSLCLESIYEQSHAADEVIIVNDGEINNKLLSLDNTILTPHALCWTDECFSDIADEAIQSILDFIDKKEIKNKVNYHLNNYKFSRVRK